MKAEEIAEQLCYDAGLYQYCRSSRVQKLEEQIAWAIKQAQRDAYEDAARIAEMEKLVDMQDETDEAYQAACEHIIDAIRNKSKELE